MAHTPSTAPMPTLHPLNTALHRLRQVWPQQWPGLPLVFEHAWQQLGFATPRAGSPAQRLLVFGRLVAKQVELDGAQRCALGKEPRYHNRLHIADALVCMTYLLKASVHKQVPGAGQPRTAAMALAIVAGHDFLHPGGANVLPCEFEARAVQDLQPWMAAAGLSDLERQTLAHCILATEPTLVKGFHQKARAQPFDLASPDCMAVLVQEADIMASTLPQTSPGLTQALADEWKPNLPEAAAKLLLPQNRLLFLEHAALFSSPAALGLGLEAVKRRQVKHLEALLSSAA